MKTERSALSIRAEDHSYTHSYHRQLAEVLLPDAESAGNQCADFLAAD